MLWKLCVLVAFGLSDTVTATDVAKDQPKKESLVSRFFGKGEQRATEPQQVSDPPKYSVEWYLLPEPESRKELREELPYHFLLAVPEDCNQPILPVVEKRIRKFLSMTPQNKRLYRICSTYKSI
ncbi:SmORF protein [Babesia bovis T2Bo]|uniref:SmORF n=1 Tax=Babesia bovis TaxID=5865 RepID=A7AR33_BABBO|nr:SmORF protein [Babesia bovis T2Bo]EDO07002.1 SmORF protein [Babesia bovis T2Bo]|eukprot:XP_001610570.1 SmORF [Babesia bovis T2Bo]